MHAQTALRYTFLKNVLGMAWAGCKLQKAEGCPVWEAATACPMLVTALSSQH